MADRDRPHQEKQQETVIQDLNNSGEEATEVYDLDAAYRADGALVVVEGEDKGRELPFHGDSIVIGRGKASEVVLSDISISREHFKLVRQGSRYLLIDLGSGNGTLVNGQKVSRQPVKSGDLIEAGSTVLKFQQYGDIVVKTHAPPPPMTAEKRGLFGGPRTRKLIMVLTLVILALCVVGLVKKFRRSRKHTGHTRIVPAAQAGRTPRATAKVHRSALDYFIKGVADFREQRFEQAKIKFDKVILLLGKYPKAERYLKKCAHEIAAGKLLREAQRLYKQGDHSQALDRLALINSQSAYRNSADDIISQIKSRREKLLHEAHGLLRHRKYTAAHKKLEELLETNPNDAEALDLKKRLFARRRPRKIRKKYKPVKAAIRTSTFHPEIEKAQRRYSQMKFDQASALLTRLASTKISIGIRKKARTLAIRIEQFKENYLRGQSAQNDQRTDTAIPLLQKAARLDRLIMSGGRFASKINNYLANMYFLKARYAYSSRRYISAYRYLKKALGYNARHRLSKGLTKQLEKLAEDLYNNAYMEAPSHPDRARKKYKLVIQITPAKNHWHRKAKSRLKSLPP